MGAALNMFCSAGAGGRPLAGPGVGVDSGAATGTNPRTVLVVDDEPDLADLAEALLCVHGLEVRVAYSANDALRILASDPGIDAVFSDVMMPGMTGLQLAEAIRHLYPSVRVVLTSGFTAPALMAGVDRPLLFAAKPYAIETVLRLLRS